MLDSRHERTRRHADRDAAGDGAPTAAIAMARWWPAVVAARSSARSSPRSRCSRALLAACGGNQYEPPPPPEVTVAQPVEREVTTLQRVHGPHGRDRGGRHPRARAGHPAEHALHARHRGEAGRSAVRHRADALRGARRSRRRRISPAPRRRRRPPRSSSRSRRQIFERKAGSKADLVQKTQARDEARAAVARAQAPTSPRRSSISRTRTSTRRSAGASTATYVDVGNLVGAGEATLLATIVRERPDLRLLRRQRARPAALSASCIGAARRRAGRRARRAPYLGAGDRGRLPARGDARLHEQPGRPDDRHDRAARGLPEPRRTHPARPLRARPRAVRPRPRRCSSPTTRVGSRPGRPLRARGRRRATSSQQRRVEVGALDRRHARRSTTASKPDEWVVVERPAARASRRRRQADRVKRDARPVEPRPTAGADRDRAAERHAAR